MTPTDNQAAAIRAIEDWWKGGDRTPQEFYLAGYAGTGKSTVYAIIRDRLRELGAKRIVTGSYTGKAAHVLRKKGIDDAMTLHSALYTPMEDSQTGKTKFVLNPIGPAAEAGLIAIDEASMVDRQMAADIRSFRKKILVMGDPGQLPPVAGPGEFTSREPDVFLTQVHRQAADSPILRLATLARVGRPLEYGDWTDKAGNVSSVLPHTAENQTTLYRHETQPICGINTVRWGYTGRIRRRMGIEASMPQPGEPVMCCRNDHELGIFNGAMGTLLDHPRVLSDGVHWLMNIQMEDREKPLLGIPVNPYLFQEHERNKKAEVPKLHKGIQVFDFGYVVTCHKAQGSEWPDVTVVDDSGVFREDSRKWAYTAITRASERVTFLKRAA